MEISENFNINLWARIEHSQANSNSKQIHSGFRWDAVLRWIWVASSNRWSALRLAFMRFVLFKRILIFSISLQSSDRVQFKRLERITRKFRLNFQFSSLTIHQFSVFYLANQSLVPLRERSLISWATKAYRIDQSHSQNTFLLFSFQLMNVFRLNCQNKSIDWLEYLTFDIDASECA